MARKPKFSRKPLFFKIMFGDFSEKMRIPPNFVKNFNGKPPAKSVLRDCSGRSWNVEVKQGPNGFLFFQNGWQYFVNDNFLEMGDLLIYQFDGNSYFDVTIFDKSGCEKVGDLLHKRMNLSGHMLTENRTKEKPAKCIQVCQFRYLTNLSDSTNSGNKPYRRTNKAVFEAASCPLKLKNPHFCMTWKRKGLRLVPSIFARETGLSSKRVRILHLKDPNGRLSTLRLSHWTDGRCHFGTGQRDFGVVNELATGDTCVFELIGQNSRQKGAYQFQVHIIRAGKTSCSCSDCALMREMATAIATLSPATLATTAGQGRNSPRKRRSVTYMGGLNSFGGLKAQNKVGSMGVPVCTQQSFAMVLKGVKRGGGGGGGGALSSTCNAAAEIFQIAAIMNGLTLVGVAIGFVLLRIEATVEEE